MEIETRRKTYWPDDAQDKNVPSTRLGTRVWEESDGATSACANSTTMGSPSDQRNFDPEPQKQRHDTRKNLKKLQNCKMV